MMGFYETHGERVCKGKKELRESYVYRVGNLNFFLPNMRKKYN